MNDDNFKKLNKFFNLKKNNFINIQEGLSETINYFIKKKLIYNKHKYYTGLFFFRL